MKKISIIISTILFLSLLMVGCDVNDESSCPSDLSGELSTTESDFVGTWALTDMVSAEEVDLTDDNMNNPSTNIFPQLPECQQDVVYEFKIDRTFSIKQAYNVAGCQNKGIVEGTWKLSGGQLTLVALCTSQVYNVDINTENTLFTLEDRYKFNDVLGVVITSDATLTYERM